LLEAVAAHPVAVPAKVPAKEVIQGRRLDQRADLGQHSGAVGLNVAAEDLDPACSRADKAESHADGGGLARIVGTQEAEHLAFADLEVEAPDRLSCAVGLGKAVCCENGGAHRFQRHRRPDGL
jgi:hypothetical protein